MKDNLTLLVVGEGGREFAIAKKLKQSPHVANVYCAPGNVGMLTAGVTPVNIAEMDLNGLLQFAVEHHVDWTFVGPENVLCAGIVDKFQAAGQKIIGPNKRAAQLEGSKDYALRFMNKYHIPTAKHETFTDVDSAIKGLDDFDYPVVLKENGLAGGKGVSIVPDKDTAVDTLHEMFAGPQTAVVLEECLIGPEYSMFCVIADGQYRILPMAQDHKRAYDGDKGPNTGGMGSYCPLPQLSQEDRQSMIKEIVEPTVKGLVDGGYHYHGILYIGLMMTADGPKVIEYNVRFGDPETQVILPRLATDFAELMQAVVDDQPMPEIKENDKAILGVVLAAKGYPTHPAYYPSLGKFPDADGITIDYANVTGRLDDLYGAGGRLAMIIAEADDLKTAKQRVYDYLGQLHEPDCFYRHDIGAKAGV
ncbi:phosphoribosylamine--glycine ligase [Limosilactobacillus sp.]|uniref:phosphoribosylamine--glycine ligase n=1 Tax=Limosilactobacillus sp. TaxID=2773925 RepID=UPI00345E83E9